MHNLSINGNLHHGADQGQLLLLLLLLSIGFFLLLQMLFFTNA
jgi:hypothetical protein